MRIRRHGGFKIAPGLRQQLAWAIFSASNIWVESPQNQPQRIHGSECVSLFRRLSIFVVLFVAGCGGDEPSSPAVLVSASPLGSESTASLVLPIIPLVPLMQLVVPTYDGSGQAVHPDIVRFPAPWNGWEYWMAFTPYPKAEAAMENPSVAVSHDGIRWEVPAELKNPIIGMEPGKGYNSDPDLSYDPQLDRLVMIYREVSKGDNVIKAISSSDGRAWTLPKTTFRRRSHGIVSPTVVVAPGASPTVWYVDAGNRGCRERVTRVMTQVGSAMNALEPARAEAGWSTPRLAGLEQPGFSIWHIDVTYIPERHEYWAIYPAERSFSCNGRDLFFARSPDGIKWTSYRTPVLKRNDASWVRASLYRGSLLYDASRDAIRIYLSAAAPGSVWQLGVVEYRFAEFLAALERNPGGAALGTLLPSAATDGIRMEP